MLPFSAALGIVQLVSGSLLFLFGGLTYLGHVDTQVMHLLNNWWPGMTTQHVRSVGLLNWIAWFLHPMAWLYGLIALTGVVRVVSFVAAQEAVGESWMWLIVRLCQALSRRQWAAAQSHALGPFRPDRVLRERDQVLTILSCRERPEWSGAVTLQFGPAHYRLLDAKERADGDHRAIAYRFRPARDNELIRRLEQYQPLVPE